MRYTYKPFSLQAPSHIEPFLGFLFSPSSLEVPFCDARDELMNSSTEQLTLANKWDDAE